MDTGRTFLCLLWVCGAMTFATAQYISEFHYDNVGGDQGEFIEVVIQNPQPTDLKEYKIYLYRSNGTYYRDRRLYGIAPLCSGGMCYYVWTLNPINNGPSNGIALVRETDIDTTVYDFISYEGTLTATDGGAVDSSSTDIGISEDNSTPVGWSLQKRKDGVWIAGPETKGYVNPIELLSFDGFYHNEKKGVVLEWRTASELNNRYFEIQKSFDQRSFRTLAEVAAAGHSQELRSYSFIDLNTNHGQVYYRLKQVDYDGSFAYSPVIAVAIDHGSGGVLANVKPVLRHQEIYLSPSGYRHPVDLSIYDGLGRRILYLKQIRPGGVIPFSCTTHVVLFYKIQSQGRQHSGRFMTLGQ